MDKPDVDLIEGLSPAISIDQKTTSHNPRSTVGTITEIYDYLRLLFAKVGHPHCPNCGREISKMSVDEIVSRVIKEIEDKIITDKTKPHKFIILSPIVRNKKANLKIFLTIFVQRNKSNYCGRKNFSLDSEIDLIKTNKHKIEALMDTISFGHQR